MYALTDYACFEAISSLPLSGDMLPSALMSKILALLPADHQTCFFLCGPFLQRLLSDVRAHLVHDWILDPLSLALHADTIYQSQVSSSSALHYVPAASDHRSQPPDLTSCRSDSPSLCWYHQNHTDQAQKCRAQCSWSGNSWPAGVCIFPTCQFHEFFSGLSSGQVIFQPVSGRLRNLCFCFSESCLILRVLCQASHCRWFFCLVFWFQNHSSTFWFQ